MVSGRQVQTAAGHVIATRYLSGAGVLVGESEVADL